mmetsp:Transcript_23038/g.36052  ORF Transcript_23038/g.36052 Transcript_23038/m.36052 type:complete len:152 (+) Transcript_23038:348-803(+)|eukprot:CAMPEP_0184293052 /NCGR_PEP_ID=MMETSP1049-20130417/4644_1 /TAXON_ID=77928 /ORGANISM="Proteomonas sulcata, Strain CCMP704" /LENGTH=151 /DNA_ID=CAMNT_0026600981 /DNA_START=307 /DNA_END=762 /DNA_ORIENTATION=+
MEDEDAEFMKLAEAEAELALAEGEVPVGCVIVKRGKLVVGGHNLTNLNRDATQHAEMVAIDRIWKGETEEFEEMRQGALLSQCTLYVTCEPCIMCAAALAMLQVNRVVFGCANDKFGGNGSVLSLHETCPVPNFQENCAVPGYGFRVWATA